MVFKIMQIQFLLLVLFMFSGCTLIRMGQEGAEKVKTSTTYGYQNGVKPEKIRNVKDYIVDQNDFVIIAETPYQTLYKTRNESNMGRLSILNDLMDYCEEIKGSVKFGNQFTASMATEYDSIDFEFSSIPSDHKKYKDYSYTGWMKCSDTNDNFEIKRKARSKYFLITHEKEQPQGYALQWYIDYFNVEDVDISKQNIGLWSYSSLVQLAGICTYHEGKAFIANRYTKDQKTPLNTYFISQLNPLNDTKGYLLSTGMFSCEQSKEGKADFIFDISYSKKYRKLLFTKRE
jgi:hypothetical protein